MALKAHGAGIAIGVGGVMLTALALRLVPSLQGWRGIAETGLYVAVLGAFSAVGFRWAGWELIRWVERQRVESDVRTPVLTAASTSTEEPTP